MGVRVHKNFFNGLTEALADIAKDQYWPTTLISEPTPPPPVHWHDCEAHGYVMSGSTWILDGATGERLTIEPGDKLVIPAGALHIEGQGNETVVYIVAISEARSYADAFRLLPADDPSRPQG